MKFNGQSLRFHAVLLLLLLISLCGVAQIRLPQILANGMVLQRGTKINIWGWAGPAEKITLKFKGKTYHTVAGKGNKWTIALAPMKAGGPFQMDIIGSNHISIHDILVGDVWFCSGQSNMVIPMERVREKYAEDISKAQYPMIRNFFVKTVADVSAVHDDLPAGKWQSASPESVMEFGAVSYFFAKEIYDKYHVPVGIINSSVGGTPIEAWMSEEAFSALPQYQNRLTLLHDTSFVKKSLAVPVTAGQNEAEKTDAGLNEHQKWYDPDYQATDWKNFWMPGYWADQGVRGLNGVVWFRKDFILPSLQAGAPCKLFLGRIVDADQVYLNGQQVGNTTYQYPPRRYALPQGLLQVGKNTLVVRVVNYGGKGGFVPDKKYCLAIGKDSIDLRGDWKYKVGVAFPPQKPEEPVFSMQNEPTGLYNTMVAPVIGLPVKGVLWYQGEANTFKPKEYGFLLPMLIENWRKKWNQKDMPFLYAQLPNFMEVQYLPAESLWAQLRQEQLNSLSVKGTGMAVTIDAGEWNDIHPLNKKDVGHRLALLAENMVYGDENLVASGPLYKSGKVVADSVIISFNHVGGGLISKGGGKLLQFAIAGADKKFVWAEAVIRNNQVVVWNNQIQVPMYVRYAWADNPDGANLYNKEGLPASPFMYSDQQLNKKSNQ